MRRVPLRLLLLATALTLAAGCGPAGAQSQFDLVCKGQLSRTGGFSPAGSEAYSATFHVDLSQKRICFDNGCDAITSADAQRIVSRCTAGARFCEPDGMASSAGPFVHQNDFEFDRASGRFERRYSGRIGDPAAVDFADDARGLCTIAPFTGAAATR